MHFDKARLKRHMLCDSIYMTLWNKPDQQLLGAGGGRGVGLTAET